MRRRIGSAFALALLVAFPASAQNAKAVSVIAGTVFREPGFALPGAVISLEALADSGQGKKPKPQKFVSDSHGEFAFRLPAGAGKFQLTAAARGFVPQTKEAQAAPGVRVDVFFELKPETK